MDFVHRNSSEGEDARRDVDPSEMERIPEDLVDAFFDDELSDSGAQVLMGSLHHDPKRARDVVSMQHALDALRRPVSSPDLSDRILRKLDAKNGWLSESARGRVRLARYAAVAALLLMVGGAYFAQRTAPELMTLTPRDATVGEVVDAVSDDAAEAMASVRTQLVVLSNQLEGERETLALQAESREVDRRKTDSIAVAFGDDEPIVGRSIREPAWEDEFIGSAGSSVADGRISFLRASFLNPSPRSTDVPCIVVDER